MGLTLRRVRGVREEGRGRVRGLCEDGRGGADASLRSDRMFVCTQSTFLQGLLQLVTSRAQADAPATQAPVTGARW